MCGDECECVEEEGECVEEWDDCLEEEDECVGMSECVGICVWGG